MEILVTGGCGFIGSNTSEFFARKGHNVTIIDNLYRKGSEKNMEYLKKIKGINFIKADIVKSDEIEKACRDKDIIIHTAAQTAVTKSIENPREDFQINLAGTFNVIESARKNDCGIIFCSTNKVYGNNVNKIKIRETQTRYEFDENFKNGIDEDFPIDASEHTPYGVTKMAADQYIRDYSTIYGIKTAVNRLSCIYGKKQFGTTDQGWVVHFIRSAIFNKTINIYGDGKQVRDILFVEDLVKLFEIESNHMKKDAVYNVGGGKENTISLLELMAILEKLTKSKIKHNFYDWRPADQKVYYSDIKKVKKETGWSPETKPDTGIEETFVWINANMKLFE